jgi:hypothetical protein
VQVAALLLAAPGPLPAADAVRRLRWLRALLTLRGAPPTAGFASSAGDAAVAAALARGARLLGVQAAADGSLAAPPAAQKRLELSFHANRLAAHLAPAAVAAVAAAAHMPSHTLAELLQREFVVAGADWLPAVAAAGPLAARRGTAEAAWERQLVAALLMPTLDTLACAADAAAHWLAAGTVARPASALTAAVGAETRAQLAAGLLGSGMEAAATDAARRAVDALSDAGVLQQTAQGAAMGTAPDAEAALQRMVATVGRARAVCVRWQSVL